MKLRLRRYVVLRGGKWIGADSLLVVDMIALPVDYAAAAECGGAGLSQAKECVGLIGGSAFVWCGSCLCVRAQILPLDTMCSEMRIRSWSSCGYEVASYSCVR
jgi:hypothetical protein